MDGQSDTLSAASSVTMIFPRPHLAKAQLIVLFILPLLQLSSSMRLVVQRVKSASVTVTNDNDSKTLVSQIGPGILALVGLHEQDTHRDLEVCCKKLLACKLWPNEIGGLWRHGVKQKGLEVLLVSQFTLYGTLSKKHQPDYKRSMKAEPARQLYDNFLKMVQEAYEADKIKDGVFGAMMDVELVNDGPVTLILESDPLQSSASSYSEADGGESAEEEK
jgi:D-tyrosyl-tRNA(Tyr) deacylase